MVKIMTQISTVLAKLHECDVTHQNIKLSNILIRETSNGELILKLADPIWFSSGNLAL